MLLIACFLLIFIGFVHSYLGEKYLLMPLFKQDSLPKLYGSDWFAKRVLRFAWHLTTIAWWGFAAIFYLLTNSRENLQGQILLVLAIVFAVSGVVSFVFSQGKHLSWLLFMGVAIIGAAAL